MMEQPSSLAEMNYVNFEQYERLLRTLFTLRKQSLYMIMCNAVIFQLGFRGTQGFRGLC